MKDIIKDRITFLTEKFDVFECDGSLDGVTDKMSELAAEGWLSELIVRDGEVLGIVSKILNKKGKLSLKVSVCSFVFTDMIIADPTNNKIYVQWMLNLFSRLCKDSETIPIAIRLVLEDLPQANSYLILFESNKRKKKFKNLCKASYALKHIEDPTDINQYKSLSQLFDVVDPFIEKEPSSLERVLNKFVESGEAEIPVKDRKYTLFIPKSVDASIAFDKFTNWCTAKSGNGMFKRYTEYRKPNGDKSDIYIIINNLFFDGKSDELYQVHFESNQLKDRKNGSNVSIFENVLLESEGIHNYFHETLMVNAKANKKGIEQNLYLDYLVKFGFADSLFDMIDIETPTIRFMNREIPKLPNISKFNNLDQLIICSANMVELHESIGDLINLEMLVLSNNKIKQIPKEIGKLQKLIFLNLSDNPILYFPEEIKYLDKSNGGSLLRLGIKEEQIGGENYKRLKELLPQTQF